MVKPVFSTNHIKMRNYYNIYREIQEKAGEYWGIQENTGEYRGVQEDTKECRRIQENTGEYRGIQRNTGEYGGKQKNTGESKKKQVDTREYKGILGNNCGIIWSSSRYTLMTSFKVHTPFVRTSEETASH